MDKSGNSEVQSTDEDKVAEVTGKKKINRCRPVCPICGKDFKDRTRFKDHQNIHTGERPFQCDICDKTFGSRNVLYTHKRYHMSKRSFKCDTCGKAFLMKSGLENHMRTHTGEKPFACSDCGKHFVNKSGLYTHPCITKHKPKLYSCNECAFIAITTGEVKRHKIRVHENMRNGIVFECKTCEKKFKYSVSLKEHEKTHTGAYLCTTCGKVFTKKKILTQHELIHIGIKPYLCNVCGKTFRQSGTLLRHKSVHTGTKPYSCKHCKMEFLAPSLLEKHVCKINPVTVLKVEIGSESDS